MDSFEAFLQKVRISELDRYSKKLNDHERNVVEIIAASYLDKMLNLVKSRIKEQECPYMKEYYGDILNNIFSNNNH